MSSVMCCVVSAVAAALCAGACVAWPVQCDAADSGAPVPRRVEVPDPTPVPGVIDPASRYVKSARRPAATTGQVAGGAATVVPAASATASPEDIAAPATAAGARTTGTASGAGRDATSGRRGKSGKSARTGGRGGKNAAAGGRKAGAAPETVYAGQAAVTEPELLAFLEVLPRFRAWAKGVREEAHPVVRGGNADFLYSPAAARWVTQQGWEPARFFCVMGKMAAALVIVEEGNDMHGTRPADMPEVEAGELALARRHLGALLAAGGDAPPINR